MSLDLSSHFLISCSTLLAKFLGPHIVENIHYCLEIFCRFMLIDIHFRRWVFPVWQFILFSIAAIYIGGQLERRVRVSKLGVLNDFTKILDEKKTLLATAIAHQGKQKISATVEIDIGSYVLNLATESAGLPKTSEQHHFTSPEDFFTFIEKNTIFRAGDFK